jgi:type IV pilus assembly protein PilE
VIQANNNYFKAKTIAVADFDGDDVFNVWKTDKYKNLKELV